MQRKELSSDQLLIFMSAKVQRMRAKVKGRKCASTICIRKVNKQENSYLSSNKNPSRRIHIAW